MAWRLNRNLIEGELDNTERGRVIGWMDFVGLTERVTFNLKGDFHRDIRGSRIRLKNTTPDLKSGPFMEGFSTFQIGFAGDITAGLPPEDYVDYPYIEWFSDQNGRVVLELEPSELEVIGTPYPWKDEAPNSAEGQEQHMRGFLKSMSRMLNAAYAATVPTAGKEKNEDIRPKTSTGKTKPVTFGEILAACNKAGVRVYETSRSLDPHIPEPPEFFHQLGNGKSHGPFEHEDEAYEDAFHTYYLWPW
jgi:hypothetical protein